MKAILTVTIGLEIDIEPESGVLYVRSDKVPGMHVIGKTGTQLAARTSMQLKNLLRDNHKLDLAWVRVSQDPDLDALTQEGQRGE